MYAQRLCLGDWKVVPAEGALQDTYGLHTDTLTFGVGLLDNLPCLIVRLLQSAPPRIGYAYTLLLDPGEEVWERFKWNGAELAYSLFGNPAAPSLPLLTEPEAYSEEKIESFIHSVKPRTLTPPTRPADALLALLVGSVSNDEPTVATPQAVGLPARPGLKETAARLASLPVALRNGAGWLVGGSRTNGRSFGVRFVLDDGLDARGVEDDAEASGDGLSFGREVIAAWNDLSGDAAYAALISERENVPVWRWQEKYGSDPQQFFLRLLALAALLRTGGPSEGTLQAIDRLLLQPGELDEEIRQARRALSERGGKFSGDRAELVAHDHPEGESSASDSADATYPDATVDAGDSPGQRDTQAQNSSPLSDHQRLETWEPHDDGTEDGHALDREDVAQEEVVHLLLTSDAPPPPDFTPDALDDTHRDALLQQLLTGGEPEDDDRYRAVFFTLLRSGQTSWQKKVAAILSDCEQDAAQCRSMLRRFMQSPDSAEKLIESLPETSARAVMSLQARRDPAEFEERAYALYSQYLDGHVPSPYLRALARFLASDSGYEVKTRISSRSHGFFNGLLRTSKIDRNLVEIIGHAEEARHEASRGGFMNRFARRLSGPLSRRKRKGRRDGGREAFVYKGTDEPQSSPTFTPQPAQLELPFADSRDSTSSDSSEKEPQV
jgi:hypothetical protein